MVGDGLAPQSRVGAEAARAQAAARHVDDDAADLDAGHALGRVDRKTRSAFRRLQIDHRAALDAVRALMADAQHLASVGSPAQRLRRLHRRQAGDQAHNLGSPDVEHRENGALARRNLAHPRRERREVHGWAPLLAAWPSAQAAAASSDRRANTRPGTRKSSARTSFSRMRDWRWRMRSSAIAASGSDSGSLMSMPDFSRRFHRRWSTSTPASTRGFNSSIASSRATNSRTRPFAPSPTTKGSSA